MSSERQIATNRLNGRKSRGPRTAAGKSIASRNALRHGLAAIAHRGPMPAVDVEQIANALCGDDRNPSLFVQARIVAENELVLRTISAQQLAVVERVRDSRFIALAKGDKSLKFAKIRFRKTQEAYDEIVALREELLERHKNELPPPIITSEMEGMMTEMDQLIPLHLEVFLENKEEEQRAKTQVPSAPRVKSVAEGLEGRDESAALEEASLDLIRLDRYERRAWSRQKRAMRSFMNIKLMMQLGSPDKPN